VTTVLSLLTEKILIMITIQQKTRALASQKKSLETKVV